jgi:ribosomal protein L19E
MAAMKEALAKKRAAKAKEQAEYERAQVIARREGEKAFRESQEELQALQVRRLCQKLRFTWIFGAQ